MNIWEILGIPPTTDIVRIKRAYGEKAKTWHPEEHPEEFKRLRSAYQAALQWARGREAATSGKCSETKGQESAEEKQETTNAEPTGGKQAGAEQESIPGKQAAAARPETDKSPLSEGPAEGGKPTSEEKADAHRNVSPGKTEAGRETPPYGEEWEEPPNFSYDDVSSFYQKELGDRFFREFHRIVWNPYLQNKKAVWSYFLFRPDFEDLFCHEGFRQRLLDEICMAPGWHGDTLEYFERWEELWREPDREWRGEAHTPENARRWRRKKWRSRFTSLMPEHVVSQELRQEHYTILQVMKDRGLDERLLSVSCAGFYLKLYGEFVEDNENWLEEQRSFSSRKRRKKWLFSGAVALALAVTLFLAAFVNPILEAVRKEEFRERNRQEERPLQEERESREQEKWSQELEERFDTMQEQYRDWLEQSAAPE